MSEDKKLSRRSFLSIATAAMGGLIGAGLGFPAIGYIVGPTLATKGTENWIRVGSIAKIELGSPTLFKVKIQNKTGWIVSEQELTIFVVTENGRDFVALSNVCTHLGCRIRWIEDQKQFYCPCHNGIFDKDGKVVSGPPPRPLDRYQVKVEGEQLYILGG
jgi:menaquinol-cytochrome c reductase iron-sulfur subunit